MSKVSPVPQCVARRLSFIVLPWMLALLINGCGSSSSSPATLHATATPTATSAKGQTIYTLVSSNQGSAQNLPTFDLKAYDGTSGHLLFSRPVSGASVKLVAMSHFLGVSALRLDSATNVPGYALLIFDRSNGTPVRQIPLGQFAPAQLLALDDTIFAMGALPSTTGSYSQLQVLAVNASTGAQLWQKVIANATGFAYFVLVGHAIIGMCQTQTGSEMIGLATASGSQTWQMPTTIADEPAGTFVGGNDAIYSAQLTPPPNSQQKSGAALVATDAATGATRWSQPFAPSGEPGAAVRLRLIAADQQAVYGEVSNGTSGTNVTNTLVAFSATDGHQLWHVPEMASLSSNDPGPTGVQTQSGLYATVLGPAPSTNLGLPPDLLIGVNARTGAALWRTKLSGPPLTPLVSAGASLCVGLTGQPATATPNAQSNAIIAAFNASTGAPLWQVQTSGTNLTQLVVSP